MKMVKSLLLGSAAGLVAVGGAQAADLPVKAKPVEYVKICTLYGEGFYYIPGSDTCLKLGGYVRGDYGWNVAGARTPAYSGTQGAQDRTVSQFSTRHRANVQIDTRTQTAYGTLRTFQTYRMTADTPVGTAAASTGINLDNAIVQWAGFTMGRLGPSFLDGPWNTASNYLNGHLGSSDLTTSGFVLAYTHQFGNGISGSIALEDPKQQIRQIFNGTSIAGRAPI